MNGKLPHNNESLSEGFERAIKEPIEVAGKAAKGGIDTTLEGIQDAQNNMRKKRTREENFLITMASCVVALLGVGVMLNNFVPGFILLIIAVIITLLPPRFIRYLTSRG
ncbi:MAG: hypothetical protein ACP5OU_07765 [Methanothrix sp.]